MSTTTLIENVLVKETRGKGEYERFYRRNPPFTENITVLGEIGVVAYANRKTKPKFSNKGRTCMFVGYATSHAGDVYRMLDMNTKLITVSRDIRLLNKSYKE